MDFLLSHHKAWKGGSNEDFVEKLHQKDKDTRPF